MPIAGTGVHGRSGAEFPPSPCRGVILEGCQKMPCKEAWELFRSCFNDDDDVVIVTDNDTFDLGTLCIGKGGLWLDHGSQFERFFKWEAVLFMAHDGFPVKRLMGPGEGEVVKRIHPTNSRLAIRDALLACWLMNSRPRHSRKSSDARP